MPLERSYRAVSRCWLRELSPQGQEWAPRFSERALRLHCTSQGHGECSCPNSATSARQPCRNRIHSDLLPWLRLAFLLTSVVMFSHTLGQAPVYPPQLTILCPCLASDLCLWLLCSREWTQVHSQVYKCYKVYVIVLIIYQYKFMNYYIIY